MILFFAIIDSPLTVKVIIFFLIALIIFTIGLFLEKVAVLTIQDKGSKSFDKEFNSGEMLDAIYNRLYNKPAIFAPLAKIFFVGMKELTQSNIRNIDFSMPYAEDIKRNIRQRMLSMTSVEKNDISLGMKEDISLFVIIAIISPLIGIAGTMYGLMYDLYSIKQYTNVETLQIVNALYSSIATMILGILASIVSVVGYNLLTARINKYTMELELFSVKVANILSRELDFISANTHAKKAISNE